MRLPRTAAATALAVASVALIPVTPAVAQTPDTPFLRVTFICKATEDGEPANTPGFSFTTGDYIFRYRNEVRNGVGVDVTSWMSGIRGSGLHSGGPLAVGEVVYQATPSTIAGVSVTTTPGPNRSGGTASTNETQPCSYPDVPPEPTDTPMPTPTATPTDTPMPTPTATPTATATDTPTATPTTTPAPTDDTLPTDVPAGRSGSSNGVSSTQLVGLAAVATVGVAGAMAATRTRRQES